MKCVSLSVRFFSSVFIFLFSVVSLFAFPLCTTGHLGDLSFVTQTAALPVVANRLPPTQNLLLPPRRKQWKSTRPTQVVRQKDDVRFEQWLLLIVRLTCCVSLPQFIFCSVWRRWEENRWTCPCALICARHSRCQQHKKQKKILGNTRNNNCRNARRVNLSNMEILYRKILENWQLWRKVLFFLKHWIRWLLRCSFVVECGKKWT